MSRSFLLVLLVTLTTTPASGRRAPDTISLADLKDRIEGGWAGQMIGVSFGAPTEFRYLEKTIDEPLPDWKPENVSNALDQDDLYVDMTLAEVLDEKGLSASSDDFGATFKNAQYRLWHANLAARRALKRGVPGRESGTPRYNAHANDIDFQIEADFIGLMAPGLPDAATEMCSRVGRVMNSGDGIFGGMFVSAMYAAAFFETDPRKVVEAGVAVLPPASPYAQTIADVLAWSKDTPDDWKAVWQKIEKKWNTREPCPEGALKPFNIDAKLNGAYIALGLLFGQGDFGKTIEIAARAGQDSDCNPSNAGGVLGAMIGYSRIPDVWKSGIPAIADSKFNYTKYTFHTIVDSTMARAIKLVEQNGGHVQGNVMTLTRQTAKPSQDTWWDDYGSPAERIAVADPRWKFTGTWDLKDDTRVAATRGAEATIEFEGTGAIVVGTYLVTGGRADVYMDGAFNRSIDGYSDEEESKTSEALWHAFKLSPGRHSIRLVVRGEPFESSRGSDIVLKDLVVFR